jgi:hypothetical protein
VFRLDLPGAENVRLHLYDASGRAAATRLNEVLPAGSHTIEFDGRHLPDGIYLAVLTTGATTQYRSVILMKGGSRLNSLHPLWQPQSKVVRTRPVTVKS